MRELGQRLTFIFFISGITGLVYEVIWAKHLALLFGNTAHAHTVVLATFLGGLALGNALFGPVADRARSPLRLYAYLEIAIGIAGGLSPILLSLTADAYVAIASGGLHASWLGTPVRLLLSVVVILPATLLMGGTLPALSRFATRTLEGAEASVSWLYFINSLGAVSGCLLAGFLLIPWFGINAGIWISMVLNLLIGIVSWVMSRGDTGAPEGEEVATVFAEARAGSNTVYDERFVRVAYAVIFVSGVVSLALEIAWIRILSLILGSSAYSFSVMLAAFIAGITLGSFLVARRVLPWLDSFLMLGLAEIGVAVGVLLTMPLVERLPTYLWMLRAMLARSPHSFATYEVIKLAICLVLMLIPTTFIGMTLPLASRVAIDSVGEVGGKVGRVFSLNTLGNVLGAVAAGLFLMPLIGIRGLVFGGLITAGAAGAVVVFLAPWPRGNKVRLAGVVAAVAVLSTIVAPGGWHPEVLAAGTYRRHGKAATFQAVRERALNEKVAFYRDDADTTVTVVRTDFEGITTTLRVNGKPDASSARSDVHTQSLLAHIPLLLRPAAESALVIGLGSGMTAGAALKHPIARLDVVEISEAVVEAAAFFNDINGKPFADPRTALHVDDAKSFMRMVDEKYDVIISEPSNPWVAGVGALFTAEFYRQAKQHLRPDGIMGQWLHTYELDDDSVRLILRTLSSEFAHVGLWNLGSEADLLLVGSDAPLVRDFAAMDDALARPTVAEWMETLGITHLSTVLAAQTAGSRTVLRLAGEGPLNRDLHPILEYEAPKAFFVGRESQVVKQNDERFSPRETRQLFLTEYLDHRGAPLDAAELEEMTLYFTESGVGRLGAAALRKWVDLAPDDPKARWQQVRADIKRQRWDLAASGVNRLLSETNNGDAVEYLRAAAEIEAALHTAHRSVFEGDRFDRVVGAFHRWEAAAGEDPAPAVAAFARFLATEQQTHDALSQAERAVGLVEAGNGDLKAGNRILREMSLMSRSLGETGRAISYAQKALRRDPEDAAARELIGETLAEHQQVAPE